MASSHTSYGRLIMLFASLDASCLWFTQIHTHNFFFISLHLRLSYIFACWRLFILLIPFFSSSHTEECAGNKRKKYISKCGKQRLLWGKCVAVFFSLRYFFLLCAHSSHYRKNKRKWWKIWGEIHGWNTTFPYLLHDFSIIFSHTQFVWSFFLRWRRLDYWKFIFLWRMIFHEKRNERFRFLHRNCWMSHQKCV